VRTYRTIRTVALRTRCSSDSPSDVLTPHRRNTGRNLQTSDTASVRRGQQMIKSSELQVESFIKAAEFSSGPSRTMDQTVIPCKCTNHKLSNGCLIEPRTSLRTFLASAVYSNPSVYFYTSCRCMINDAVRTVAAHRIQSLASRTLASRKMMERRRPRSTGAPLKRPPDGSNSCL
jgi:hypothetical protein